MTDAFAACEASVVAMTAAMEHHDRRLGALDTASKEGADKCQELKERCAKLAQDMGLLERKVLGAGNFRGRKNGCRRPPSFQLFPPIFSMILGERHALCAHRASFLFR